MNAIFLKTRRWVTASIFAVFLGAMSGNEMAFAESADTYKCNVLKQQQFCGGTAPAPAPLPPPRAPSPPPSPPPPSPSPPECPKEEIAKCKASQGRCEGIDPLKPEEKKLIGEDVAINCYWLYTNCLQLCQGLANETKEICARLQNGIKTQEKDLENLKANMSKTEEESKRMLVLPRAIAIKQVTYEAYCLK